MPTYLVGLVVFGNDDFKSVEQTLSNNIIIRLWARKELIDEGYGYGPLAMSVNIMTQLLDIFRNVDKAALPEKIGNYFSENSI
jgi:hypothetical protein